MSTKEKKGFLSNLGDTLINPAFLAFSIMLLLAGSFGQGKPTDWKKQAYTVFIVVGLAGAVIGVLRTIGQFQNRNADKRTD
jgi:membrane associated rhomboid family serine protease